MKKRFGLAAGFILGILSLASGADDLSTRHPLKKAIGEKQTFEVRGGGKLEVVQDGDKTTISVNGGVVKTVVAPQFVNGLVQTDNGRFALFLIGTDRTSSGHVMYDYHSIIRLEINKKGRFFRLMPLLVKTEKMMKQLSRWVVEIDSVLNDGRTARVFFGEQIAADDPSMEIRYAWQVRDLDTGKLYREEKKDEKEKD